MCCLDQPSLRVRLFDSVGPLPAGEAAPEEICRADQIVERVLRLHLDYAGPFMGKMFLVAVDAYSKYLDVIPVTHATSSATKQAMQHDFSVFGLPEHVVTDNGILSLAKSSRNSFINMT